MKRAIFFVLLLVMELLSYSQNLVVNPGFEIWTKINRPAGWTHAENCLKDSVSFYSGDYSCMQNGYATTTSDLGQTIRIESGKEYMLSLYNRTITTSSGKGSRIWCYWIDSEGNKIYDPITDDILRPSQYFKSETWQYLSICVTAPPDAADFYLEVRTNSNSTAYWDDFVFEENLATNNHDAVSEVIGIYPNPVHDYLNISNIHNLQHIEILSFTGSVVLSASFSGETTVTISVSALPEGPYLIKIISSKESIIRKFIKR